MGYEWHPVFRQTPDNGSAVVVDTRASFTDLGGPETVDIGYDTVRTDREDINRRARSRVWGFRQMISLGIYIDTMADSGALFQILSRLARDDWTTELSLDGSGTYRTVELEDFGGPQPLGGKTVAGARFELSMRGVDLLSEIPEFGALFTPVPTAGGPSLPTPSAAWRWILWTVAGTPDVTYQCLRNSVGAWGWVGVWSG